MDNFDEKVIGYAERERIANKVAEGLAKDSEYSGQDR